MFEFLFKYPPDQFARGTIEVAAAWWWLAVAALAGAAFAWFVGYGARRGRAVAAVRAGLVAAVAFALFRPELVVSTGTPGGSRVAILVDDSRSMRVADVEGGTRGEFVVRELVPGRGGVARAIDARFDTEWSRFSDEVEPLHDGDELEFSGGRSRVAHALEQVLERAGAAPPGAIVLVSDGAESEPGALEAALRRVRAAGVPVYTVGVGAERFERDVEIDAVRLPVSVLPGDALDAEIALSYDGLGGAAARLVAEHEGRVVREVPVLLPAGATRVATRLRLDLDEPGWHRVAFRVEVEGEETIAGNNEIVRHVRVRRDPVRVLHFEGEPRFEVKFLRRAVTGDEGLGLVSVVRTAENKFYRLGVRDADELAQGFPDTDASLFEYHALVVGSVEASHFTAAQSELLDAFASRRGGGLLFLGGRNAFAEGGYGESPIARMMPVVLASRRDGFRTRVAVQSTYEAADHPLAELVAGAGDESWSLPPLTLVNPIRAAKPGATTLLAGDDAQRDRYVVLAHHRYGRGTVASLPVRDTWRWQMDRSVPRDDPTHETFWRQTLRWLARGARERLSVSVAHPAAAPGEPVEVRAELLDERYRPAAGAELTLSVTTPLGDRERLVLAPSRDEDGAWVGRTVPRAEGLHELRVRAVDADGVSHEAEAMFEARVDGAELHRAQMRGAALRDLAERTGGKFFATADVGDLADEIVPVPRPRLGRERLALWDAPFLFVLIAGLACLEWVLRRRVGLA